MAAPMESMFDSWLSKKLTNINPDVDLEVFVSYITGILETDTDEDDRVESISGILAEITEEKLERHCEEIVNKWTSLHENDNAGNEPTVDEAIQEILNKQQAQIAKSSSSNSKTSAAKKAAILAKYSQVSDGEITDDDDDDDEGGLTMDGLVSNMNTMTVAGEQKKHREQLKEEHEKKKAKDKEDREKQKQKVQDRKESEKKRTAKGERRR